jgi:hypothetical protein
MSKNIQAWHGGRLEHYEQLLPLGQLPLPNRLQVINSRTKIKIEIPRILKGFKPFWKNLINSIKFYRPKLDLKIILHYHTCNRILEVPLQVRIDTW